MGGRCRTNESRRARLRRSPKRGGGGRVRRRKETCCYVDDLLCGERATVSPIEELNSPFLDEVEGYVIEGTSFMYHLLRLAVDFLDEGDHLLDETLGV